jgi:Cytochrome P460
MPRLREEEVMSSQRLLLLSASAAAALALGVASVSDSFGQGTSRPAQAQQQRDQTAQQQRPRNGADMQNMPEARAGAAAAAGPPAEPYATGQRPAYRPEYDAQGRLIRPTGWRDWQYIGTPLTPNALNPPESNFPEFHNVYMEPAAWDHFKRTGEFRDGTVLVKELVRVQQNATSEPENGSTQEASGRGYFMAEYSGLEATIKDDRRFADQPGHWSYFTFGHVPEAQYAAAAAAQPADNCNACHAANAGRDFVFIQHYPVLRGADSHRRR